MSTLDTCVVTGGAGAIGSHLVGKLLDSGAGRVLVIDNLTSGYRWLLPNDPRVIFCNQDVADLDAATLSLTGATVFHLAAFFANQNSVDHPADDLHTNGLGTLRVLKWAAETGCRRVVYASAGCSIAGHGHTEPIREDMPVSLELDTPYQITKALGEFYCNYYNAAVSTVRCRFFNSYGPGEVPGRYRNVIPNFVWWALSGQPLPITGTGEETRDFIYVGDLTDGLLRCALTPEAGGQAFNLGTGRETRIIDLARAVLAATGSNSDIVFRPRRDWDHSLRRQADIGRARAVLGMSPGVGLEDGLARTVAWFRDNLDNITASLREEL